MADPSRKVRCKYQNFSYCKYQKMQISPQQQNLLDNPVQREKLRKETSQRIKIQRKFRRGTHCFYRHDKTLESKEMLQPKNQNKKLLK